MASPIADRSEQIRYATEALSKAVREMTPVGAKSIPYSPSRFNLLARPSKDTCRICCLPGHSSDNINQSIGCLVAIMSTVGFWEDMAAHISLLYSTNSKFTEAIIANEPTYEMLNRDSPLKGVAYEEIFVNRLTRNYLCFQAHMARIMAKFLVMSKKHEVDRYETITKKLNDFLLKGASLSDLFKQSLDAKQDDSL